MLCFEDGLFRGWGSVHNDDEDGFGWWRRMEPSGLVIVTPVLVSVISCPCLVKSSAATSGLFISLLLYTFAVSFKPV